MNYDEDLVFHCIKELNNNIGMWNNSIRSTKIGKFSSKMLDKVKRNGFYIGLYNNFEWIDELELKLKSVKSVKSMDTI